LQLRRYLVARLGLSADLDWNLPAAPQQLCERTHPEETIKLNRERLIVTVVNSRSVI